MKTFITNCILGSWKTSMIGFTCGVLELVIPSLQAGKMPTTQQWILAAATVFLGMFAKDHDKAGTGGKDDPLRGPLPEPDDVPMSDTPPQPLKQDTSDTAYKWVAPSHGGDN